MTNKDITIDLRRFNKSVKTFEHTDEKGRTFIAISYRDAVDYLAELHQRVAQALDISDEPMEID